jgi:orotate phosphoribosyltransferase
VKRVDDFVEHMIERDVLQFGDFVLKSGVKSPYFFNLGAIDDGPGLDELGAAYATAVLELPSVPEVLFGPAYKGIPIAVATSLALTRNHGRSIGVAFNRKEAKLHGEGGQLVGHAIRGSRVVIVDDVITAGTAVTEAYDLVTRAGGKILAILVALDRQERLDGAATAAETMTRRLGVPVKSIVTLEDVVGYLGTEDRYASVLATLLSHQQQFGAASKER